jgi:lactate permease
LPKITAAPILALARFGFAGNEFRAIASTAAPAKARSALDPRGRKSIVFQQIPDPLNNLFVTWLVALVPVIALLLMLAVFRISAWLATLVGSLITFVLAVWVWHMPADSGVIAYLNGSATGIQNIDWITFWGVVLFNTLVVSGTFEKFRLWLIAKGTADVRVQTLLFAWAFGALLEGLVGFGYPWAFVAPILISLGIPDLDAIRVAAIANNAPVSYGALGSPIIALASVTAATLGASQPELLMSFSSSVGKIVAILALLPPWILLYLVSGWQGIRGGWPLAIVGSFGYIIGQLPVAIYFGPFLPDVVGAITSFAALLILLRLWQPATVMGYGGKPVPASVKAKGTEGHGLTSGQVFGAWLPFIVLVVVVVLWTGPFDWAKTLATSWRTLATSATSASGAAVHIGFDFRPGAPGTAILVAWLVVAAVLLARGELKASQFAEIFAKSLKQMWGAMLVGVFIFGLAIVYNYSGMAASLANAFSTIGVAFIIVAPVLGWIGVALSGSNTSTNAMFGVFQTLVGKTLGFPLLLLPTLNSVGAEIGKPVAPQTASVGVSTSRFVRNEGAVIRHNMGWTFALLVYLILIGVACYLFFPSVADLHK